MIAYSLRVAIILSVCLGFYKLALGKQTYYRLNRAVLLTCLVLAFALPLIPVPQVLSFYNVQVPAADQLYSGNIAATAGQTVNPINILQWLNRIYWFGVAAFGAGFLIQAASLLYQSFKNESMRDGRYKIVELETDKAPCSFCNYIFINPAKYDWETYNRILLHEKIHVREYHTIDLMLCELMLIFQWFNPLAWLFRKAVEDNLEFLTDDTLLKENAVDASAYQWSLLQVSVPNYAVRLATNYNQSLLKKRIMMMDAKRSNVHTLWKYVMLIPILALLVCGLNKPAAYAGMAKQVPGDTTKKAYPKTYPQSYPAAPGYTQEGIKEIQRKDSIQTAHLVADLSKDGIISSNSPLSFKLSDTGFTVNGQEQPAAVFKRYHQKYAPQLSQGAGWVWTHNIGQPGK